jgi:hypothetical protein
LTRCCCLFAWQVQLRALAEAEAELRRREEAAAASAAARAGKSAAAEPGAAERRQSAEQHQAAPAPATPPPPAAPPGSLNVVDALREEGNACLRAGAPARAAALYSEALRPAATGVNRPLRAAAAATLYANRAAAHLALRDWEAAAADAQAAVTLQAGHVKALHRLATARSALGHFRQAVAACRAGEAALAAAGDRSRAFQPLLEQARASAALLRACFSSARVCVCVCVLPSR